MKRILFLTSVIFAFVFIFGCKSTVPPSFPAAANTLTATQTPNSTQTIEALAGIVNGISASKTAIAVLSATKNKRGRTLS